MGKCQGSLANHIRIDQEFLPGRSRQYMITSHGGDKPAFRSQDLDPVIRPVRHVNVPVLVRTHRSRPVKLANAIP